MSERIRIGIADDEPLFAAGLAMILDSQADCEVVWRAVHGQDALALARREPVDVLLMDVQMPVLDGIDTTGRLVGEGFPGRIIILTTFDTDDFVLRGIEAGASGFLLKTTPPGELVAAVRAVHSGDSVISPGPTRAVVKAIRSAHLPLSRRESDEAEDARRADDSTGVELTDRESEILALVAQGLTNQEICDALWLSMPTVKTHVSHLLAKTGSRDRVQLVLFALRTGVLDVSSVLSRAR